MKQEMKYSVLTAALLALALAVMPVSAAAQQDGSISGDGGLMCGRPNTPSSDSGEGGR